MLYDINKLSELFLAVQSPNAETDNPNFTAGPTSNKKFMIHQNNRQEKNKQTKIDEQPRKQKLKLITGILYKLTRLIAKFNHNQYATSDISDLVNVDISTTAMHLHSLGLIKETKEAIASLKATYKKESTK